MRLSDAGDAVDMRTAARAMGAGRIALGLSYVLAPGLALRVWPGGRATTDDDAAQLRHLARSTGGRDVALGAGVLLALSHDAPVRGWLEAASLADAVDAVAILLAFRHIPRTRGLLMLGGAVGAAAAGRRLASALG